MNRRLLLGVGLLAALVLSAGCTSVFGPGEISHEQLSENATYDDWGNEQDVTYNVSSDEYQAVYKLDGKTTLEVYQRESLGEEGPVEVAAVKFRYPNGTVVGADEIRVKKTRSKTIITPPHSHGELAYTAPRQGKTFSVPTYLDEKTYEVVLPRGMRVGNFLLSDVHPDDHDTEMRGGRVHVTWDESVGADSIAVRYYLARDETIFGGIIAVGALVALAGLGYFRFQIRQLEREREEMGLSVDISDDDSGGGPPPGMR